MKAKGALFALMVTFAVVPAAAQPAASAAPAGAASCSGCHMPAASAGIAVPPIVGRAPDEIVTAMQEFRSGARAATVMDRIAKGFSDDEARAIATWLAAQRSN